MSVPGTRQKWMLERIEETFSGKVTTDEVQAFLKKESKMVSSFLEGETEPVVFVYFQPAPNYEVDKLFLLSVAILTSILV
jgi:hypothetical protein